VILSKGSGISRVDQPLTEESWLQSSRWLYSGWSDEKIKPSIPIRSQLFWGQDDRSQSYSCIYHSRLISYQSAIFLSCNLTGIALNDEKIKTK